MPFTTNNVPSPLTRWFANLSEIGQILVLLAATYVILLPQVLASQLLPDLVPVGGPSSIQELGLFAKFVVIVIFAPLLETALFQWGPIRIIRDLLSFPVWVAVLVSAALFSATHTYSIGYVFFSFAIGLVFAAGYIAQAGSHWRAFRVVFAVHALRNCIALALKNSCSWHAAARRIERWRPAYRSEVIARLGLPSSLVTIDRTLR